MKTPDVSSVQDVHLRQTQLPDASLGKTKQTPMVDILVTAIVNLIKRVTLLSVLPDMN